MTPPFDRREFVRLSSVAALAGPALLGACADEPVVEPSTCGTGAPDQGVLWDENPLELSVDSAMFPLPPQSGAMRSESALIWGYADGPEALNFWVWREEAEQRFLVHSGTAQLVEGYAKVTLEALAAGQWYEYLWYHEDADGGTQRGVAGRFRTAFEPGCSAPIVVAATSCTNRRLAPSRSLEMMAEAQPDMFLQLGDMSYNDGAQDQQEYRDLWHETLSDPGYAAILAKCGMYVTWDDHEIVDSSSYYNTGETRRRIATEAWFETLATPRLEADRFWDSYRWGDTAEFFVLDCRSERQPESRRTPEAAYISRAQMDWLKAGLSSSTATWKVILNSVPMTNWPDVTILESDRWEGYEAQRQELVDYLVTEDLDGVLVVSGDFHCGAVSRLEPVGPARKYFEVLVGPGANGGNPLAYLYQMGSEAERGRIFEGDQFAFLHHGMSTTLLTFDGDAQSVAIQFVDPETEEERFSAVIYADGRIES